MNKTIENIALLGTSRKPFSMDELPEQIQKSLLHFGENDAETSLLRAIYLHLYFQKSGNKSFKLALQNNVYNELENKTICHSNLIYCYQKIKELPTLNYLYFVEIWLDRLIKNDWILPNNLVVTILKQHENLNSEIKQKTINILGKKAATILPYFPTYQTSTNWLEIWKFGKVTDRKIAFLKIRNNDLNAAYSLLDADFFNEPLSFQKLIIESILSNFTIADVAFFEKMYENNFKYLPKEKSIHKECRYLIASKLLQYDSSILHLQTVEKLQPYFSENWLLKSVKFNLPNEEDSFWNEENMDKTYGIELKNMDIGLFHSKPKYWLSHFIQNLPLEYWNNALKKNSFDTISYFARNEAFIVILDGKKEAIFYPNLLNNAYFQKNKSLSKILIENDRKNLTRHLFEILSISDFEELIIKNELFFDENIIEKGIISNDASWSLSFSTIFIQKCYDAIFKFKRFIPQKLILFMQRHLHKDSKIFLMKLDNESKELGMENDLWKNIVFIPIQQSFEIRALLNDYKTL